MIIRGVVVSVVPEPPSSLLSSIPSDLNVVVTSITLTSPPAAVDSTVSVVRSLATIVEDDSSSFSDVDPEEFSAESQQGEEAR